MPAEIISVGTELLLGHITDTNATFLCERLAERGVDVYYRSTVGDNQPRIVEAIRLALSRADIVILSGGLGPTTDDLTKEAIAEVLGMALVRDAGLEAELRALFAGRSWPMAESNLKQADVLAGGAAIPNACGTAPGVFAETEGKLIFAVPGVPREMAAMVEGWVIPELQRRGRAGSWVIRSRTLRLAGIGESAAAERVQDLLTAQSNPTIAPLAGAGEVKLRITAKSPTWDEASERIAELEERVRERLGDRIFGVDDESLEQALVARLLGRGLTIATAESCTGGLIGSRITDVNGSSGCYAGGVVSYSNEAKARLLGVRESLLEEHGAVSAPVAREMAVGVRRLFGTDLGVSATGIAGPSGATAEKPVGLVYIAVAFGETVSVEEHRFGNDRLTNKFRTSQAALDLVRRAVPPGLSP